MINNLKKLSGSLKLFPWLTIFILLFSLLIPETHASASTPTRLLSKIESGSQHTCFLLTDGAVKCWGSNNSAQLGDGTRTDRFNPTLVPGLSGVVQISANAVQSCAVLSNGSLKCWGSNRGSALSNTWIPVLMSGFSGVVQVTVGGDHTCALLSYGRAKCWGGNSYGQLGVSSFLSGDPVFNLSDAVQISAGNYSSCAVLSDGRVKCWGSNIYGQLGNGSTTSSTAAVWVTDLSSAVQVSVGGGRACAVLTDGTVKCWGRGNASLVPETISELSSAVQVSVGDSHSCATLSSGEVRCWGSNSVGQLGDGSTTSSSTPVAAAVIIPIESSVGSIAATSVGVLQVRVGRWTQGATFSYQWFRDGILIPGANSSKISVTEQDLGHSFSSEVTGNLLGFVGKTVMSESRVHDSGDLRSISSGTSHSCIVLPDGSVNCWGANGAGQLGDGSTINRLTPVAVSGLSSALQVFGGSSHSCALLTDSSVRCWGSNSSGQLGDGSTINRLTPVAVSGLTGVVQISGSSTHSCALLSTRTVKCWGGNNSGQLGDGSTIKRLTAVTVSGLSGVVEITAGSDISCALMSTGQVKCWGSNSFTPAFVAGLNNSYDVVEISARGSRACALLSDGTVKCWLSNNLSPVTVSSLSDVVKISIGVFHSCALLSTGLMKCWGANAFGQLGDGSRVDRLNPVFSSGLSGVVHVSVGLGHSCAVLIQGSVSCWGSNEFGQLGDGSTTSRVTPASSNLMSFGNDIGASIGGEARAGQELTSIARNWPAGTTHTYRWYRDGISIAGAIDNSYETTNADLGKSLTVAITGHLEGYISRAVVSPASSPVVSAFATKPTIAILGNFEVGSTLTAISEGSWGSTPDSTAYQWSRAGKDIPNATAGTYTLTLFDAGSPITVRQIAYSGKITYSTENSLPTINILRSFTNAPNPTILGLPEVGQSLQVDTGLWSPLPEIKLFEWYRDGVQISGQTSAVYVLQPADQTHLVTVKVTAIKSGFSVTETTSSPIRVVSASVNPPPVIILKPSIDRPPLLSGSNRVNSTIKITNGLWSGSSPTTTSYRWYRCNSAVREKLSSIPKASSCSTISGANKSSYKLTSRDRNKYITALVTTRNVAGTASSTCKTLARVR